MTDIKDLEKQIEEMNDKIRENKELIRTLKAKSKYSEEQMEVATMLHDVLCHSNHTDACGWYYDRGDWSEYSRQKYIKKAIKLLTHFSKKQIEYFINLI